MATEKILVVDDEKIILDLTLMILRSKGYEVFTAESGREALEVADKVSPSLVLLDYMMPEMDGLTALRRLREQHPDIYVIMFTGKGSEEIAVELMKAGASDYILKPFNNQDLLDRIENVLRIRRIELHNRELRQERERLLREIEEWNLELENRVAEKSRELERAHAEILQTEKLAALGHLSAGMAHEIRNPLNTISLFAQILQGGVQEDPEKSSCVEKILKEVDRIDDILVKLLAASKRPQGELSQVSIAEVIDRALEASEPQARQHGVRVNKEFVSVPPPIQADPAEVEQIFSNLFLNSLYEMSDGGELGVRLAHDDSQAYIDISDTGGGIPEENLGQVFDPFFTTKEKGTGFGLSVVLRIVKTYGGGISVDSQPGEGTVFHIRLPLVREESQTTI